MVQKPVTEIDLLQEISGKLSDLLSLLAVQGKTKEEQTLILVGKGYSNKDIAELLGIPKGTIDGIRAKAK